MDCQALLFDVCDKFKELLEIMGMQMTIRPIAPGQ